MRRQFKPRASSTPFLARRSAGESRLAHSALHPDSRSDSRPSAQGALCGVGGPRRTRGTRPRLSPPRGQVIGGRAGTWRAGGRTCRDRGRRPSAPASRGPEAGGSGGTPDPGSRAACARRRARAAAAGGPLPAGGRRAEGSGEREEGEGRREPPGRRELAPRGASCAGGGKASERILVARFSGWWCLGTGTPSAAAGFAEALARQVSTHTPSWFAANKARHRKRRSKCYSPCTGPRASRAEQPPFPLQNDPFAPQTPRTCLGCPERSLGRRNPGGTDPSSSAANVCCCCRRGRRAQGADQTESPRICNLAPRSAHGSPLGPSATQFSPTQPKWSSVQIITDLTTHQKLSSYPNPCKTPEEI